MALDAEQRRVALRIRQIAREVGASPKQIKAAYETGLVESGLRNLPGGDADSQGWRQERASLYADPRNLDASIRRFFRETAAVKGQYGRAGALAAAVQRPAAQYRGRYEERSAEADALMRQFGAATGNAPAAARGGGSARQPTTTGGVDNSALRGQAVAQFLGRRNQDPLDFALNIRALRDTPGEAVASEADTDRSGQGERTAPAASLQGGGGGRPGSPLLELFWQGPNGINAKNGKRVPQGFVSGHTGHVHVAAGPKTIMQLARLAQQMGLRPGEHEKFGGVAPVHVTNSNHYAGRAIDVTGPPAKLAAYARRVAALYGISAR